MKLEEYNVISGIEAISYFYIKHLSILWKYKYTNRCG